MIGNDSDRPNRQHPAPLDRYTNVQHCDHHSLTSSIQSQC